jgi:cullin 1
MLDEELLIYYVQSWETYTQSSKVLDRVLEYLNRHWIKRELDEAHRGIYPIFIVPIPDLALHGMLARLFLDSNSRKAG